MNNGWHVTIEPDDRRGLAHYYESDGTTACAMTTQLSAKRPYDIAQDIGRVETCEFCKKAIVPPAPVPSPAPAPMKQESDPPPPPSPEARRKKARRP